jgi:hypothetical protein
MDSKLSISLERVEESAVRGWETDVSRGHCRQLPLAEGKLLHNNAKLVVRHMPASKDRSMEHGS